MVGVRVSASVLPRGDRFQTHSTEYGIEYRNKIVAGAAQARDLAPTAPRIVTGFARNIVPAQSLAHPLGADGDARGRRAASATRAVSFAAPGGGSVMPTRAAVAQTGVRAAIADSAGPFAGHADDRLQTTYARAMQWRLRQHGVVVLGDAARATAAARGGLPPAAPRALRTTGFALGGAVDVPLAQPAGAAALATRSLEGGQRSRAGVLRPLTGAEPLASGVAPSHTVARAGVGVAPRVVPASGAREFTTTYTSMFVRPPPGPDVFGVSEATHAHSRRIATERLDHAQHTVRPTTATTTRSTSAPRDSAFTRAYTAPGLVAVTAEQRAATRISAPPKRALSSTGFHNSVLLHTGLPPSR